MVYSSLNLSIKILVYKIPPYSSWNLGVYDTYNACLVERKMGYSLPDYLHTATHELVLTCHPTDFKITRKTLLGGGVPLLISNAV